MRPKREAVCAVCGRHFLADRKTQRFCSAFCRKLGYRRGMTVHEAEPAGDIVLRSFRCARCGALVEVKDLDDRRRRFCSVRCERLYWKHRKSEAEKKART